MSFELTQGAAFYIVMMVLVILIGIGIVTGFKTPSLNKIKALAETFEPGRIYITNEGGAQSTIKLDCANEIYKVELNDIRFATKKGPRDESDTYKFLTVLDYKGLLFVGKISGSDDVQEITCKANDEVFVCEDNLDLEFELRNLGAPEGNQIFHFTAWESNPAIKNILTGPGSAELTLSKLLDDYGSNYISSFDATANIEEECARDFCTELRGDEAACKGNNERGCYWKTGWTTTNACSFCPEYTNCKQYSNDECTQCPIPKANCELKGLPIFESCEAIE